MAVTRLDLLRHGACEGGEIFRGSTDVPLSELGWQQMRDTVTSVGEPRWQHIVSSPLRRCARFAEEQAHQLQLPLEFDDALREMHFGDWEGLPHSEAERRYPQEWRQFWQSPAEASPPNGEAMGDFCLRVCTALDSLQQRYSGESVLLVIHGAVIRVMMCHLLGMPMGAMTRLAVPYACLSRFSVYQLDGHDPWVQLHKHG